MPGTGKGNTFENDLLELIFKNTSEAGSLIGSGLRNAVTAGSLYVSLHTSDPDEGGTQSTGEIAYTGYARQAVARSGAGWTVTANSVSPAANIDFPEMTGGAGGTVTHFGVGTEASGTGKLLYMGSVSPTIAVTTGVIPRLTTATAITED